VAAQGRVDKVQGHHQTRKKPKRKKGTKERDRDASGCSGVANSSEASEEDYRTAHFINGRHRETGKKKVTNPTSKGHAEVALASRKGLRWRRV